MIYNTDLNLAYEWGKLIHAQQLMDRKTATSISICLMLLKSLLLGEEVKEIEYAISFRQRQWHIKMTSEKIRDKVEEAINKKNAGEELASVLNKFLDSVKGFDPIESAKELSCLLVECMPEKWLAGNELVLPGLTISWEMENLTTAETLATIINSLDFKKL